MSLENPDQTQPFRAPQDEIQWGILLLTKQLQNRDLQEREQYLQELWEWARQRADLLSLQIIRDYRESGKRSGPTYLRHRIWSWSNRDNPQFLAEWQRRFSRSEVEGEVDPVCETAGAAS